MKYVAAEFEQYLINETENFWRGVEEAVFVPPFGEERRWRGAEKIFRRGAKNGVLSEKKELVQVCHTHMAHGLRICRP